MVGFWGIVPQDWCQFWGIGKYTPITGGGVLGGNMGFGAYFSYPKTIASFGYTPQNPQNSLKLAKLSRHMSRQRKLAMDNENYSKYTIRLSPYELGLFEKAIKSGYMLTPIRVHKNRATIAYMAWCMRNQIPFMHLHMRLSHDRTTLELDTTNTGYGLTDDAMKQISSILLGGMKHSHAVYVRRSGFIVLGLIAEMAEEIAYKIAKIASQTIEEQKNEQDQASD